MAIQNGFVKLTGKLTAVETKRQFSRTTSQFDFEVSPGLDLQEVKKHVENANVALDVEGFWNFWPASFSISWSRDSGLVLLWHGPEAYDFDLITEIVKKCFLLYIESNIK